MSSTQRHAFDEKLQERRAHGPGPMNFCLSGGSFQTSLRAHALEAEIKKLTAPTQRARQA